MVGMGLSTQQIHVNVRVGSFAAYLDDRFHETSIGEANRRGTERMLVDSSFEELNEERHHGNMAASA